jgi:hypothetical protein
VQICDACRARSPQGWRKLTEPVSRDEVHLMPEFRPSADAPLRRYAARCNGIRDRMLVGFVLFTLVRTSEALAGDQASLTNARLDPNVGNYRQSSPPAAATTPTAGLFTAPVATDIHAFSATDFRPRKHTIFDTDPAANSFSDAPMLRVTTVWQRMSEYKSPDRVRLLTLWQSSGSTVSLQAGKRGDPSLQWTSRLMNRGGSTQGLLDRLFSVSLARAGDGLRNSARSGSSPATGKQVGLPVVAGQK